MSLWDKVKKAAGAPAMAIKTAAAGGSINDVLKAGGQASVGGQVLSSINGNDDSVFSKVAQGDFGGATQAAKSHAADKAAEKAKEMEARENDQYGKNQEYNTQLGSADDAYLASMGGNVKKYQGDLDSLRGEIEASQKDAGATYSNQIQPRLKGLMETAQKNSAGAMSLQDAMDPNNAVAAQTRKLYADQAASQRNSYNDEAQTTRREYNKQGSGIQQQYNQQAQNEGKAGLADVGVLGALGMQNMAGQLGNVPMTGGQLQAMMGANQAQSGAAYAQTQQRMNALRDQGLQGNINLQNQGLDTATQQRGTGLSRSSDLGTQGLAQGFNRSDTAYGQGLQAQDRYKSSIGDYEGAADRQQSRNADFRSQRGQVSNQGYNLQQAMNDATRGAGQAKTNREMAAYNQHMGGQQANTAGQIAQSNAQQAQQGQMISGGLQAMGTIGGAYFGGPAGAAAGGQAGAQIGAANQPAQQQIPQAGNYSYGGNGRQMGPPAYAAQGSNMAMPPDANQMHNGPSYAGPDGAGAQGLSLAGGFGANPYAYQNQQQSQKRGGNARGARS